MKRKNAQKLFNDVLQHDTLKHYNNLVELGRSPLATVYFLGDYLRRLPPRLNNERSVVLRELIWAAAGQMWGDDPLPDGVQQLEQQCLHAHSKDGANNPRYLFWVLEMRYFRRYYQQGESPQNTEDYKALLGIEDAAFFATIKRAIAMLGEQILQSAHPAFRLESPTMEYQKVLMLLERDELKPTVAHLQKKESVAINGLGGTGKTTLGVMISDYWSPQPVFWHTFRATHNDTVRAVWFAIAHFLHLYLDGKSLLWRQLQTQTERNEIDRDLYEGLLGADLAQFGEKQPLFCFDEVNMLGSADLGQISAEHQSILLLLSNLATQTPMLLIGQRIPIDVNVHISLSGISLDDTRRLFAGADIHVEESYLQKLWQKSEGNLRWLELCISVLQLGESPEALVEQLPSSLMTETLVKRLWMKLEPAERDSIKFLAVFETPAPSIRADPLFGRGKVSPANKWLDQNVLNSLAARHLVRIDAQDGVTVLRLVKETVLNKMAQEERERRHLEAVEVFASRGFYTESAYHLWKSGRVNDAVKLWHVYMEQELQRGQFNVAYHIFQHISLNQLAPKQRKQLQIIRNRLYLLGGDLERIVSESKIDEQKQMEDVQILTDVGRAQQFLGDFDAANNNYEHALTLLSKLSVEKNLILARQMWTNVHRVELLEAQKNVEYAQFNARMIQGELFRYQGNYENARDEFLIALALVEKLENSELLAHCQKELGNVYVFMGEIATADICYQQASQLYGKMGNTLQMYRTEADRSNSHLMLNEPDYQKVVYLGEGPLQFFREVKHQEGVYIMLLHLAEAYMELGELDRAETYAREVYQAEEAIHFPHALYTLGMVAFHKNRFDTAVALLKSGVEMAEKTKQTGVLPYLNRCLGKVYQKRGQVEDACTHFSIALEQFARLGIEHEVERIRTVLDKHCTMVLSE